MIKEEKQIHLYGIDYDSLTKMLYRQGYVDRYSKHPDFNISLVEYQDLNQVFEKDFCPF